MKTVCESKLGAITGKKYVVFTKRGNKSILVVLKLVKHLGFKKVFTQDQGGWITYSQFIKKLKLEEHRLKTNYGLIDNFNWLGVLLFNSMPGYIACQDMESVAEFCKLKKSFLINDVSGSIGTKDAFFGDLIIGSFGRWKPLNMGKGGFIATSNKKHFDFLKNYEDELDFNLLEQKLLGLKSRLSSFHKLNKKIKTELSSHDIIYKYKQGINVVVKFSSDSEKERLINYCKRTNYEYVECPKYIRVLDDAISIEVKRID